MQNKKAFLDGSDFYRKSRGNMKKNSLAQEILKDRRISQLGLDSYNFCRAFHGGSSEKKKNQNFIICLCRDIYRIDSIFFRKSDISKNLFRVFLFDNASPAAFDQSSS